MELVVILGLILFNGLLSMAEMSVVSSRKSRLELEAKKGSKAAQRALELSNNPDDFLSAIQIGITLIGILTGLFSGEAFAGDLAKVLGRVEFLEPYAYGISEALIVVAVTYLTLVFGELVPKRLGLAKAEAISKAVAKPMTVLTKITYPIVWLLAKSSVLVMKLSGIKEDDQSKVTEEEVKAVIRESLDDGEIDEVEHDIVERVFNLGDRNVSSIMTHRKEVVFLDVDESVEELRMKIKENVYNTYPVISGEPDNIVGVVHLKDIFGSIDSDKFMLQDILKEVFYLPKELSVYDALDKFKSHKMKSAIITDEYGGMVGVVTLKDILEALVGAMPEESEANDWVTRDDGSILVDGQYSFYEFLEKFDKEHLYQDNDFNTVSGLVIALLNEIPHVGQKVSWDEFTLEILDMDGARVDKILVSRSAVGDEEE
ncbi:MAG: HlyC/CorC family transporter [Bacteroidales bacterium]|nr:HlyC/CorC family transporter [Bacteroidales bacterium]